MSSSENHYHISNRAGWNRLAESGSLFAKVATDEECAAPLETLDGSNWLPTSVEGLNVLCLAAGGGWQSILYASAGANVTVIDLSPRMLQQDREQSLRRDLQVRIIEGSMDDLSMLEEDSFDIVHQPVSTCYVPDLTKVYREIGRVLKTGGLYLSQHKQPTSLQITHRNERNLFVLGIEYYHQSPLPGTEDTSYREAGTTEYLHRWETLIGELCKSGFVVEDLREPNRARSSVPVTHFGYRGRFVPPYVRIKARRIDIQNSPAKPSSIWTP